MSDASGRPHSAICPDSGTTMPAIGAHHGPEFPASAGRDATAPCRRRPGARSRTDREPRSPDGMADAIAHFGALAGTRAPAHAPALEFRQRLAALRMRYRGRSEVGVCHKIWDQPTMSVNGEHLISQVLRL